MDTPSSGITLLFLIFSIFCTCSYSSQLYLQPTTTDHAYFTGDNFFITCFTIDETIEKLKWTDFDGNPIENEDGRIHVQPAEGDNQNGRRIVFTNVEKDDAGTYTCSDDADSVSFELVVYRSVSFTDTPKEQHAPEGENAMVLCNVRSDPKPSVHWYFKGKKIESGGKYKIQENHSLRIHNLSRNDAGLYKCKAVVITQLGSQVKDFDITLHVQYIPEIQGKPEITTYASKGSRKNLVCNVTAVPAPMFQWLFDEMIIHNNTENFVIYDTDNSSVLQVLLDHEDRRGQYICRASNALGEKEVIINLKEGDTPRAPTLDVVGQDQNIVKLSITLKEDPKHSSMENVGDYLDVTKYKVEYRLASVTWDNANTREFMIGEQYELKNMSYNAEYVLRAAAYNDAGYGNYSEDVTYMTHSLQTASVISSASSALSSLGLLLISIFIISSL